MSVLALFYFISNFIADSFVCSIAASLIIESNEVGVIS